MDKLWEAYGELRDKVLALRDGATGVWSGELSSSALGTALAVSALGAEGEADRTLARAGAEWLAAHANADGGWGDTPESASNLSTTLIAAAALRRPRVRSEELGVRSWAERPGCILETRGEEAVRRAEAWLAARAGSTAPEAVVRALGQVYGADRTFAVPILAFLAMCGGAERAWLSVPPLPFLLALLPQGLYRFFRLQVVSYALPALIAVGLCRHVCAARARGRPAWGRWFAGPLLLRLARLQPEHGGYLDAIPLTAFVCLALRHAGYGEHAVAQRGLAFLRQAARGDGSWAIDSNLRSWVTSLAARALTATVGGQGSGFRVQEQGQDGQALRRAELERIATWLVKTQLKRKHPFTGAAPGGWAWTDLPGGVPDADDTAGALIALKRLQEAGCAAEVSAAVQNGVRWLLEVQNADGGMPTFCRGWGRLPFDRSCPDISAHALAALAAWEGVQGSGFRVQRFTVGRMRRAAGRLIRYLERSQAADGSWVPLWFGHQDRADGKNPVVGTARVVDALRATRAAWREAVPHKPTTAMKNRFPHHEEHEEHEVGWLGRLPLRVLRGEDSGLRAERAVDGMLARGEAWLLAQQRADGGWGAGRLPTVEESALAVIALTGGDAACGEAALRGCAWLAEHWKEGAAKPAPIGLYFARLWYHERLYPLVWALEALGRNVE